MAVAVHQTGFIISKLEDGSYAYTMTSYGGALSAEHLRDLLEVFEMVDPPSLVQIDEEIARDGQSVVGTVTPLDPQERALCLC